MLQHQNSYNQTKPLLMLATTLLAAASLQGCAVDAQPEAARPLIARTTAPLYGNDEEDIWRGGTPSNSMTLCFQPFDQDAYEDSRWNDFTQHVRDVIEEAYEDPDEIGLSLSGWGLCSNWDEFEVGNQPTSTVEVLVKQTNTGYAATRRCVANSTIQSPLNCAKGDHVVLAISMEYWALDTAILHEFGHVLGFAHEYNRDDWDGECTQSGGTVAGGFRLTPYDPDSIMNGTYCHTNSMLSTLDKLGVEIVFPSSSAHSLSATPSVVMGDGTLVARTNSTVTDEWTARSAADGVIQVVGWTSDGTPAGSTESVSANALSSGDISYAIKEFDDFLSRSHTAEGQIVTSDDLHTAIALTAL